MFTVRPYKLSVVAHDASSSPLYPHQVAMWEGWERHSTMLLAAKTGSGKTRAAMLPVLKRREWAVAVYPTNELLRDQVRAVARFGGGEGIPTVIWTPEAWEAPERVQEYSAADRVLVPVDATLLDEWQRRMRCRSRGETLRRLLDPDKPKIVFTNPDILFLILGLRYHAEPFGALQRYETLILDEFHLYQGVELAHALAMVALARGFGMFRRLILLSATPHPDVRPLLDRALAPAQIDLPVRPLRGDAEAPSGLGGQDGADWPTAVHAVDVTPVQVAGDDPVDVLVARLVALRGELERLRVETPQEAYLPAVVIVNSVLSAIVLEDRLVEAGFARESLAIIRGLSHRAIRETKGKLLALGTSAIEVGVDFHCDYLLFEASEAASFLQRFGRVGRHGPGRAIALVPPNAFRGMCALPREVDRATFEERIHTWYPSASAHPWFATTEHGMITARTLGENLIATVARDTHASPGVLEELRQKVEGILSDHAERLGCEAESRRAKRAFERRASGNRPFRWVATYRSLNQFRTSLPSLTVHDFAEQGRRREWALGEYDIDLATLLKRGTGLAWNDKLQMMTIRGIGKYRHVHASELFADNDCGLILETSDYPHLRLERNGESTAVSDLMARQSHIFVVVPHEVVQGDLDWRLPIFECGRYLLAFDGAALLLVELWRRAHASRASSR